MQDQTPKTQTTSNSPVGAAGGVGATAPANANTNTVSASGAASMNGANSTSGAASAAKAGTKPATMKTSNVNPTGTRAVAQQNDFVRKISDKIKNSENILVALSRDPSVDEMAAALGLTMFLDSLQKHTTAIFSGQIPNALQFLQPEETFEANTDSLQDFIIALDKDKADHLRYKLDGDFVKIYITPYKTLITQDDLEFSRGDFNVDLVVALGVPMASDLDEALVEHGRIMHDAAIVDITTDVPGRFAEIEWSDPGASSVSEMVTRLIFAMRGQNVRLDKEIATALLTGIVAATGRFSNDRTSSETLELASKLMSMGADQQLISANVMDNTPAMPQGGYSAPLVEPTVDRNNLLVGKDYDSSALAGEPGSVVVQPTLQVTPEVAAELQANAARAAAAKAAVNDAVSSAAAEAAASGATGIAMNGMMNPMAGAEMNGGVSPMMGGAMEQSGAIAPAQSPAPTRPVLTETPATEAVAMVNTDPMAPTPPVMPVIENTAPVPDTPEVGAKDYAKMMAEALAEPVQAPVVQPVNMQAAATPAPPANADPAAFSVPTMPAANPAANAAPAEMAGEPVANPSFVLPPPPAPTMGEDMMPPVLPPVKM